MTFFSEAILALFRISIIAQNMTNAPNLFWHELYKGTKKDFSKWNAVPVHKLVAVFVPKIQTYQLHDSSTSIRNDCNISINWSVFLHPASPNKVLNKDYHCTEHLPVIVNVYRS